MDSWITALARSSNILVAAVSLPLVGCVADFDADESAPDASSGTDDVAIVAPVADGSAPSYGPLPSESSPSVGFRATFHSTDPTDPDYRERREGGRVDAIQPAGSRVFVGGYFNRAITLDGTEVTRTALAAMNASTLDLVTACNPRLGPAGLYGARVRALALSRNGAMMFVAGRFSTVGGVARNNLAAIRVSDCTVLNHFAGWSVNGEIYSLLVDGDNLYVGGDFTSIGGASRSRVAKLDVATASVSVRAWNPGSTKRVKALAVDDSNGRVILVLMSAGTVAGQANAETVALDKGTAASAWRANSGRGGMAAVTNGTNVYVGVRGLGGRVYAYRLSDGTELFWHYCNGDVQAITRYRSYITAGFHDNSVATANNSELANLGALGLWRMTPSGTLDTGWLPDIVERPGDTGKKVWSLYGDGSRGALYVGGDFTRVEGRLQERFAVFQAPP
jgi:Domain of unknown function (DUF5122) beta-propeller